MPTGLFENELTVQLWQPVTIRGYTFNVGDNLTLDQNKVSARPRPTAATSPGSSRLPRPRTGQPPFEPLLEPPAAPALREGNKVQTPWLTAFLKDPYPIRPAANCGCPGSTSASRTTAPRRDRRRGQLLRGARPGRVPLPVDPRTEDQSTWPSGRKAHPDYLGAGWEMMTNRPRRASSATRSARSSRAAAGQVVNGPDLRQVAPRFRPGYLEAWLANPRRLVPYTAMPQNIAPHGAIQMPVPKSFENQPLEMVRAIRDTLLNYVDAVELQLAGGGAPKTAEASAAASGVKTSSATP